ncbi:MAG: exosortase T [Pseudomonadales bacterium]
MKASLRSFLPALCLLLLGTQPLLWLASTWHAPGYEGVGLWAFLLVVALLLYAVTSGPPSGLGVADKNRHSMLSGLLLLSLGVRVLGALTGVNLVSAGVLALDCYVLARWLETDRRPVSIAPAWLAVVFCFCLPVEPLLQRTLGFALQQGSALLACGALKGLGMSVECAGVRMQLNGVDLLVDLPCSGARLASLGGLVFATLAALTQPRWRDSCVGLCWLLVLVAFANTLRIVVLALGIAFPAAVAVDLMAQPWHELVGLGALALLALGLACWSQRLPVAATSGERGSADLGPKESWRLDRWAPQAVLLVSLALPWLGASAADMPAQPTTSIDAPGYLGGHPREAQRLGSLEQRYFERYGALASRNSYGPHGLYLVRTNAPLRHLHAPEICLRGLGHKVRFLGTRYDGVPSSVFESTDPQGRRYQVWVSYRSETGELASSIAEVIWRWARAPRQHWTMIQRISPADAPSIEFESAVRRAFNLHSNSQPML